MEFAIGFQVPNKASVLKLLILLLEIFYIKGQRRSAVIWPTSSDVQPVSTRIYTERINKLTQTVNCAPTTSKDVTL